jgi:hypothetical protein
MNDPIREIDEMLRFVTECQGDKPDCFIDLETGELITEENICEWLQSKSGSRCSITGS